MDPLTLALLGLGSSVIGNGAGAIFSGGARSKADSELEAAKGAYNDPNLKADLVADKQGPTELNNISTDPRLRDAQMRALSELEDVGNQGGLRMQDKAALNEIQQSNAQRERGSRQAIAQNMATRGMGGSGFELASQLAAQQGAADRNANSSMNVASMAEQRALQALEGAGQMGGQIRGQDYGEAAARAKAQDDINRFNTGTQNAFMQQNRNNQYRNVEGQNQARYMMAGQDEDNADRTQQMYSGMGQAGQQAMGSYADYLGYGSKKKGTP